MNDAKSKKKRTRKLSAKELANKKRREGTDSVKVPHAGRINFLCIRREQNRGKYEDIFRVLERTVSTYGSITNAVVQLIRTSPVYDEASKELEP